MFMNADGMTGTQNRKDTLLRSSFAHEASEQGFAKK